MRFRYGTGLSFARLINDVSEKFNTQTSLEEVTFPEYMKF